MELTNIDFREKMFVYAAENAYNPTELKVTIPEVFIDKDSGAAVSQRIIKSNLNIFTNVTKPAISDSIETINYIILPVISNYIGSTSVRVQGTNYSGSTSAGIGDVKVGDRFIATFIGNSPINGVIIARC
jgi:hypothetical protein